VEQDRRRRPDRGLARAARLDGAAARAVRRYDALPRRLRLPMPGLVFVAAPGRQPPHVFAAKARPRSPDDQLFACPSYNVFPSGAVCTGTHAFPADPARVPEAFFRSF
jgi:hypothetical protein